MNVHVLYLQSIFTEALMDEQDIDDLLNIPMTPTLYWDPKGKCLKVDKEAGKVSGRE